MARIKNLGELNSLYVYIEEKYSPGWNYAFTIFPDVPIVVDPNLLEAVSSESGIPTDIDLFTMAYAEVRIKDGRVLDPNEHYDFVWEPAHESTTGTERGRALIPESLIKALRSQKAYNYVEISLISDPVVNPGLAENACDIRIDIYLPDRLECSDRFTQSFARKLNKWLAATRK